MKRLVIFSMSLLFLTHAGKAQSEVKMSPAVLGGILALSYEHGFNKDFGLELYGYLIPDGSGGLSLAGKYYLNPRLGLDRFHVGIFLSGISEFGFGGGFLAGMKIVARKGFLFEIGLGVGRGTDGTIPHLKLDFGYRLGRKKTSKGIEMP